jgi:uncharacterized protein
VPSDQHASPTRYDVEVVRDVRIPTGTPDVSLSADLYKPVGAGPVPVLLMLQPYRKDFVAGAGYQEPSRWLAHRGYASLLVDMLGIGGSDGVRRPEFDPGDAEDALAATRWAIDQPWCDGNVGMWGISYGANTTLRTASRRPPGLRAIIVLDHGLDPGRDSVHPDGARGDLHPLVNRGSSLLLQHLLPPLSDWASPASRQRWQRRLGEGEPVFLDYARHGPHHPVWQARATDGRAIVVPALCIGGWRDAFPDGLIDAYEQLSGPKRLLIGPWGHVMPHESMHAPTDFLALALQWWDFWLRGRDSVPLDWPPVTLYRGGGHPPGPGARDWRGYDRWPLAADEVTFTASGAADLVRTAGPGGDGAARLAAPLHYRPDPTVGTLRGLPGLGMGETLQPQDQHDDDCRSLALTSARLDDAVLLAGRPRVRVTVDPAAVPRRLVARLTEVDEDGRSALVTAGVAVPDPAAGADHTVVLRPVVYRVPAGRRIRIAIGDADFPRLTPLPTIVPFDVHAVTVSLPVLDEDAGVPVEVPALGGQHPAGPGEHGTRPGKQAAPMRWTITRDPIHDGVEVRVVSEIGDQVSAEGHRYRVGAELRAAVRPDAPQLATAEGGQTTEISMATGEQIEIRTRVRCTQDALWARGELTVDGVSLFDRVWQMPLGGAERMRMEIS